MGVAEWPVGREADVESAERPRSAGPPRGVLNLKAGLKRFEHAQYLPWADLSHLVEHYWIIRWDLRGRVPPFTQETVAHPAVHLVLNTALRASRAS